MRLLLALIALCLVATASAQSAQFYGTFNYTNLAGTPTPNTVAGTGNASLTVGTNAFTLAYNVQLTGLNATANLTVGSIVAYGLAAPGEQPTPTFTLPLNVSAATNYNNLTSTTFSLTSSAIIDSTNPYYNVIKAAVDSKALFNSSNTQTIYSIVYSGDGSNTAFTRAQLAYVTPPTTPTPTTSNGTTTGTTTGSASTVSFSFGLIALMVIALFAF